MRLKVQFYTAIRPINKRAIPILLVFLNILSTRVSTNFGEGVDESRCHALGWGHLRPRKLDSVVLVTSSVTFKVKSQSLVFGVQTGNHPSGCPTGAPERAQRASRAGSRGAAPELF